MSVPLGEAMFRSLTLAFMTMIISTVLGVMSAQAFRRKFKGSGFVFYLIVLGMMVPGVLTGLGVSLLANNILGIERGDMIQTLAASAVTLLVIFFMRKDLLLFCFDPAHARAIGLNTNALYYVLLGLLAATIVASLQAVGIILVVAMLITPGCTARLLTDRFDRMLLIAAGSSVLASCLGVYVSFFINGATGACIVLAQSALFALAFVFGPKHGLIANRKRLA
jgi:manganese transport system permease protein/manganese/iron transport system permease protein